MESLHHKIGDHAAIVRLQARAIGVEDADEMSVHIEVAMVGHDGGLGKAFGLIVDRARPYGVDVAPVGLHLRMNGGIAIALRG